MIKVGIVGRRGLSAMRGITSTDGVEVVAFCDIDPTVHAIAESEHGITRSFLDYDSMLDEVDAVVLGSPVQFHVSQAIAALERNKHVLSEVTAAVSLEECDLLNRVARSSRATYMLAENYCYFEENVLVRAMVRDGLFGDVYYAEGDYIHEVRFLHQTSDGNPTWRAQWQVGVPGNTYITHELGPPMQWMKAANPQEHIMTVSCQGTGVRSQSIHNHDDCTVSLVKLESGRLIQVRLDMMSNRPEMVFYSLQGTLGVYESGRGQGIEGRIWLGRNETVGWGDPPRKWQPVSEFMHHLPPEWRETMEAARASGHGGGDFHVGRQFAQAIRDGTSPDIDVFDALEWTAAGLCSQISIAQGGAPIEVPRYRWSTPWVPSEHVR